MHRLVRFISVTSCKEIPPSLKKTELPYAVQLSLVQNNPHNILQMHMPHMDAKLLAMKLEKKLIKDVALTREDRIRALILDPENIEYLRPMISGEEDFLKNMPESNKQESFKIEFSEESMGFILFISSSMCFITCLLYL